MNAIAPVSGALIEARLINANSESVLTLDAGVQSLNLELRNLTKDHLIFAPGQAELTLTFRPGVFVNDGAVRVSATGWSAENSSARNAILTLSPTKNLSLAPGAVVDVPIGGMTPAEAGGSRASRARLDYAGVTLHGSQLPLEGRCTIRFSLMHPGATAPAAEILGSSSRAGPFKAEILGSADVLGWMTPNTLKLRVSAAHPLTLTTADEQANAKFSFRFPDAKRGDSFKMTLTSPLPRSEKLPLKTGDPAQPLWGGALVYNDPDENAGWPPNFAVFIENTSQEEIKALAIHPKGKSPGGKRLQPFKFAYRNSPRNGTERCSNLLELFESYLAGLYSDYSAGGPDPSLLQPPKAARDIDDPDFGEPTLPSWAWLDMSPDGVIKPGKSLFIPLNKDWSVAITDASGVKVLKVIDAVPLWEWFTKRNSEIYEYDNSVNDESIDDWDSSKVAAYKKIVDLDPSEWPTNIVIHSPPEPPAFVQKDDIVAVRHVAGKTFKSTLFEADLEIETNLLPGIHPLKVCYENFRHGDGCMVILLSVSAIGVLAQHPTVISQTEQARFGALRAKSLDTDGLTIGGSIGVGAGSGGLKLSSEVGGSSVKYLSLGYDSKNKSAHVRSVGGVPLKIQAGGSAPVVIGAGTSNVGIGTSDPRSRLEVKGTFKAGQATLRSLKVETHMAVLDAFHAGAAFVDTLTVKNEKKAANGLTVSGAVSCASVAAAGTIGAREITLDERHGTFNTATRIRGGRIEWGKRDSGLQQFWGVIMSAKLPGGKECPFFIAGDKGIIIYESGNFYRPNLKMWEKVESFKLDNFIKAKF